MTNPLPTLQRSAGICHFSFWEDAYSHNAPRRSGQLDFEFVTFEFAAVELFDDGTGVFGRNVRKQMALANVDGPDHFSGKPCLSGNGIHNINRDNPLFFANIHP